MKTFAEAMEDVQAALRAAGYPSVRIEVHLSPADVSAVERDSEVVARAMISEFVKPKMMKSLHSRRPFGIVHGVHVYVQE